MKKYSNYLMGALCLLALVFSTSALLKVKATPANVTVAGQPVDLTYAAEKSLPAVVHIKYVQNSKVETVDVPNSPFDDFFGDFFGFGTIYLAKHQFCGTLAVFGKHTDNIIANFIERTAEFLIVFAVRIFNTAVFAKSVCQNCNGVVCGSIAIHRKHIICSFHTPQKRTF